MAGGCTGGSSSSSGLVSDSGGRPTLFQRAMQVRGEIGRGDFAHAASGIAAVAQRAQTQPQSKPTSACFMCWVAAPGAPGMQAQLERWVHAEPKASYAWLILALHEQQMGWWTLGQDGSDPTRQARASRFMEAAVRDAEMAVRTGSDDDFAWELYLRIEGDLQDANAEADVFQKAVASHPRDYMLYAIRLKQLRPTDATRGLPDANLPMIQFVAKYAGGKADVPLHMLYLPLYAYLIQGAARGCAMGKQGVKACMHATLNAPDVIAARDQAYDDVDRYISHNTPGALEVADQPLRDLLFERLAEAPALTMLQAIAEATGSDVQQISGDTRGSYIVDRDAGLFWHWRGQDQQALPLYLRAEHDLSNTHFATLDAAVWARARIDDDIAAIYFDSNDWGDGVRYGEAAARLMGGYGAIPTFDRVTCDGLFKLHQYDDALKACATTWAASGDWQARFFLAHAKEATGDPHGAMEDYAAVANGPADMRFRTYSAVEVSILQDNQHQFGQALQALDRWRNLFTPALTSVYNIASYYNDRCYAEMQLGKLQAALYDCKTSIGYQPLPDAVDKEAKIEKMIAGARSP